MFIDTSVEQGLHPAAVYHGLDFAAKGIAVCTKEGAGDDALSQPGGVGEGGLSVVFIIDS